MPTLAAGDYHVGSGFSTPRCSVCLAKGPHGSNASKQQAVLIRKLCIANEGEEIGDEALRAYAALFDQPFTDCHVKAILALFGWDAVILPLHGDSGDAPDGQ